MSSRHPWAVEYVAAATESNSPQLSWMLVQALSHAVRALKKLHSFGYAHRDIKPGNILRRHKQHDWTLIDFGCTAEIGTQQCICLSCRQA